MTSARRLGLAAVFALGLAVVARAAGVEMCEEPLAAIKDRVEGGQAVLVDVREKDETDAGHVEGALLLPNSAIQDGLSEDERAALPSEKTLYVHCVRGTRALEAAKVLEKNGFDARPIAAGLDELLAAGFRKPER